MKIIADKNIPYIKGVAEYFGDVEYLDGAEFTRLNIKDANVLIVRTVVRLDQSILEGSQVKLICSATIGYDHIDTAYCAAHDIAWRNAPGSNSGSVQQYIVSALVRLSHTKKIDLKEITIGIVGVGNVGKKIAKACEILGIRTLLNDPPQEEIEGMTRTLFTDMETIKKEADIITFHTPLTKDGPYRTYHLADNAFLSTLAKKPVIINSARGGIIDTGAIKYALENNQISGAIIDCWENEPDIDREYMDMVDIATPHIAGYSADGKANASRMSLESIAEFYGMDKAPANLIKIPDPLNPVIDLNGFEGNRIAEAILTTYDPVDDCGRLKKSPEDFKVLRNNYPLRREYPAYTIANASEQEKSLLAKLGFRV